MGMGPWDLHLWKHTYHPIITSSIVVQQYLYIVHISPYRYYYTTILLIILLYYYIDHPIHHHHHHHHPWLRGGPAQPRQELPAATRRLLSEDLGHFAAQRMLRAELHCPEATTASARRDMGRVGKKPKKVWRKWGFHWEFIGSSWSLMRISYDLIGMECD